MTNPDNVGGLLPCPFCGAEPKLVKCVGYDQGQSSISCANCDVYMMDIHSHVIETWNRRELCSAAHAGGDYRDAYEGAREDLLDWKGRAQRAEAELRRLGYTGITPDSAPAGSGEVANLASRLVSMSNGLHSAHLCTDLRRAAALLRKLQQGAE